QDSAGNLYGTAYYSGAYGYGTVYKLAPSGTFTVLHEFNGSVGANPTASLIQDSAGNLYGTARNSEASGGGVVFGVHPGDDSDGYSTADGDCDDTNAAVHPGATELCNGVDDNCNGQIDEAFADLGTTCSVGVGACQQTGTKVCTASETATQCNATPGTPSPEI